VESSDVVKELHDRLSWPTSSYAREQGRNEIRWRPGKKLVWRLIIFHVRTWGLSEAMVHCIEESTCDIVGTFRRPGNSAPLAPPSLRPCPWRSSI